MREREKKRKRERIYLSLSGPTRLLTDFCILLVVNFISQQSITRGVVNANRLGGATLIGTIEIIY